MLIKIPVYFEVDIEKQNPEQVRSLILSMERGLYDFFKKVSPEGYLIHSFAGKQLKCKIRTVETVKKKLTGPFSTPHGVDDKIV